MDALGANFGVLFGVAPIKGRILTPDLWIVTMGPIKRAEGSQTQTIKNNESRLKSPPAGIALKTCQIDFYIDW